MSFDKAGYNKAYNAAAYYTITAYVPKSRKSDIKAEAERRGITVSQMVVRALENDCKLDLS